MKTQTEDQLEQELVKALVSKNNYSRSMIKTEDQLIKNLKQKLEILNQQTFSEIEFKRILNHLEKGGILDKARTLRGRFDLKKDDESSIHIKFFDKEDFSNNIFEVANQITVNGEYKNRYDVTILVNGFPLVQIELKKSGQHIKEAFNQICRYQKDSYSHGHALFNYVQIFVISNKVNTKFFSNNKYKDLAYNQTFCWADEENNPISNLFEFNDTFLTKDHLCDTISNYIVISEVIDKSLILRSYQYWAVKAIINKIDQEDGNGYVWHTTGSGKTLTSFKASQILSQNKNIEKVVFVVDRKDLDSQTQKEFNKFDKNSVNETDDTKTLVKQLENDTRLIITTIQKLNNAITGLRHSKAVARLAETPIVFIFDECHRSQFGDTHSRIKSFFKKNRMIGFTGTPIFEENSIDYNGRKMMTKDLFDERLHSYLIQNAINDKNVLPFLVEYRGQFVFPVPSEDEVNMKELYQSEQRSEKIVDYIIQNHKKKTANKQFTAIMCVNSIDMLIQYYDIFKEKEHDFKIATIFSFAANEEKKDSGESSRDKLEEFIGDYNETFKTNFSTKVDKGFENYREDVSKRVKRKEIDILLVVDMFLTGFDSPSLNTLYVDKNLQHHGLIQAFSRTNRIINPKKTQGNIVCFRDIKNETDAAVTLFSNGNASENILVAPYEDHLVKLDEVFQEVKKLAPTVDSVDSIDNEETQYDFLKKFKELIKIQKLLETFPEFDWVDFPIPKQEFQDYQSKYLDIHDIYSEEKQAKRDDGKVSVLDSFDFELDLLKEDEINARYILNLLASLIESQNDDNKGQIKEKLGKALKTDPVFREKEPTIYEFLDFYTHKEKNKISDEFYGFCEKRYSEVVDVISSGEEDLEKEKFKKKVYELDRKGRSIDKSDIVTCFTKGKGFGERRSIAERIKEKMIQIKKLYKF